MFWFDKQNPNVLFCDNRKIKTRLCDGREFEVNPDIQCDFTNLPFANNTFRMVVFDPPHLTRNNPDNAGKFTQIYGTLKMPPPNGYQQIKYGALYSDWRDMLRLGFAECFRVLQPYGTLIFKWNETDIKVSEVLKLTEEQPLFGHKSGKASRTHWICFMKFEKE